MSVKLILNTPDLTIGGNSPKRSVDLKLEDYKDKTIKQVVSQHVFTDVLQGQDESVVQQAIELIFNFIQPKDIDDPPTWWVKPFDSLITKGSKEIVLDLEFSEEGIAFMKQMM
ncbi:MAG: hypothetical protein JJE41_09945 [Candidatus Heimdallarchaeota archaeon]|nr:hypothetical protein [Candidatus Heimdallarchaeota archaeon]